MVDHQTSIIVLVFVVTGCDITRDAILQSEKKQKLHHYMREFNFLALLRRIDHTPFFILKKRGNLGTFDTKSGHKNTHEFKVEME